MNIYIKSENERRLRDYGGSMSGLINKLLDEFFSAADDPTLGTDLHPTTAARIVKPETLAPPEESA